MDIVEKYEENMGFSLQKRIILKWVSSCVDLSESVLFSKVTFTNRDNMPGFVAIFAPHLKQQFNELHCLLIITQKMFDLVSTSFSFHSMVFMELHLFMFVLKTMSMFLGIPGYHT